MGFWYSTCMLTGLPMVGGEPALLQFLRPRSPDIVVFRAPDSLTGPLYLPIGPPLPGVCDSYGGVAPGPYEGSAVWEWQLREWKALRECGRLVVDDWLAKEWDKRLEAGRDSEAAIWSHMMTWGINRGDVSFQLHDSPARDGIARAVREKEMDRIKRMADGDIAAIHEKSEPFPEIPLVPTDLAYAVIFRPAADVCIADGKSDVGGEGRDGPKVDPRSVSWSAAATHPWDPFGLWPILDLSEADQALEPVAREGLELSLGMCGARKVWLPSTFQAGAQHTNFKQHVRLLEVALEQARGQGERYDYADE